VYVGKTVSKENELAVSLLTPLPEPQRDRPATATAGVERLILASQVRVEITDPRDIDARYCLRSYFEELDQRFDTGFDHAQSISASDEEMTLPNGLLLVAKLLGAAVGCGALKLHADTQIAEVKRMWVASDVRGIGLGRRLLERLSAEAASRGMAILRLETNRSLTEAKHLYERAGFIEVEPFNHEPYAHHWFQEDLRK
jgi:GNAT superfamily N-acetyltransferase